MSLYSLGLVVIAIFVVYRLVVFPTFVSPLSKIPNAHWSSSFSPIWILWIRYRKKENQTVHAAHQEHGSVIRLGPSEISVNCVKNGIQTIYSGGFEKHRWYPNIFCNYGEPNMFSMTGSKTHSARKRMLSNVYSKSYIQNSPTMREISIEVLHHRLQRRLELEGEFDMFETLAATTMDYVTSYIFGLATGTKFLQKISEATHFLDIYMFRRDYVFWSQELPSLNQWLSRVGIRLTPDEVSKANREIEDMAIDMCDEAFVWLEENDSSPIYDKTSVSNYPVVLAQLSSSMSKAEGKSSEKSQPRTERRRFEIASELLDHLAAGFETSAITLTYVVHELSQRPELQAALRQELRTLEPPIEASQTPNLPDAKVLDALPLLHAVLWETLRFHSAIPGGQPRITPQKGSTLGEFPNIPGGVRVNSQAYSLHRNEEVFPDAERWKPERWLTEDGQLLTDGEMNRWFWAFSSGGRMCVGSNLAMHQMKHIIALIYTSFETEIVDDNGIEQMDAYTAPPKSNRLIIKTRKVGHEDVKSS